MYEAHSLEIQASLPLHCSHGPTCLLHPVYQVLDFICCISFCCKSAAEQITQISIFFKKKKNQSFILTTVIYSHKYIGQQGLGWAVLLPMAWAGLGWADLGWAWLKVATDNLSPILYPGMAGQPGHVYLMATEEVQDSR